MKRTISAILIITLLLALVGCGSTEPTTTTLTYDDVANGISYVYELEAVGDKCQKMTQTTRLDCSAYDSNQIEYMKELMEQYGQIYAEYEGVSYKNDISNNTITEVLSVDLSDMSLVKTLSDAGLLPMDNLDADYISLYKTVNSLKSQGWTKVS